MSAQTRDSGFEWMRAAAIGMVLIIHSITRYSSDPISAWISVACRPCIGMFLFQSGFFFSDSSTAAMLRRLKRILFPYLVFAVPGALWMAVRSRSAGLPLFALATGSTTGIYYFVFLIVLLCVAAWLIRLPERSTAFLRRAFILSLVIALAHATVAWVYRSLRPPDWFLWYEYRSPLIWSPFFIAGVLCAKSGALAKLREKTVWVSLAAAAGLAVVSLMFALDLVSRNIYDDPSNIVYSLLTTLAFASFRLPPNRVAAFVAHSSYFVYLTHIYLVYALARLAPMMIPAPPLLLTILSLIVSALVPLAAAAVISRLFPRLRPALGLT